MARSSSFTPPTSAACAPACSTSAARMPAARALRLLERVRELQPHDVDVAAVAAVDEAVAGRAAGVLVDARVLDEDVRIGHVRGELGREFVLQSDREPRAIVVRQPWRALGVAHGRLVVRNAAAEGPRD